MKEFPFSYKFNQGLRPYGSIGRDTPGLTECYNVVPRRGKLVGHVPLLESPGHQMDWPYPQLFCMRGGNFLCGRSYIKTLDSNLTVVQTLNTSLAIVPWTVLDFWQYAAFTNGAAVYVLDPVAGAVIPYTGTDLLLSKCWMNYKGQIIASGVTGYADNEIVSGAIGVASMVANGTTVSATEIVKVPMPWAGGIVGQARLGDHIVVYGDAGIATLTTPRTVIGAQVTETMTFKLDDALPESIQRLGVVAYGGDETTQCFVDETGCLWKIGADLKPTELGYSEFIAPMLEGTIRISYDARPLFRDFYISDGTTCYLLTEYGLCKVHQAVASTQLFRGGQFATFTDNSDYSWKAETDTIDMNLRPKKTTEWIEGDGWGLSKIQMTVDGHTGPILPFNSIGAVRYPAYGSDFKLSLTGESYTDVILEELTIRTKLTDKTSMRSQPRATATITGSDR